MPLIETISDVSNALLSRREIVCDFAGLGGKLKKLEAVNMITKEFELDGKTVIPIKLQNHMGMPKVTGTFYVYDDENLAKTHVNPTIFKRLEKAKSAAEKKESEKSESAEPTEAKPEASEAKPEASEAKPEASEAKPEASEAKPEEKPADEKEAKSE